MPQGKPKISTEEIRQAFERGEFAQRLPPILTKRHVADMFHFGIGTINDWLSKGRFDGAYRRRGKHIRFFRDRIVDIYFNGREWSNEK